MRSFMTMGVAVIVGFALSKAVLLPRHRLVRAVVARMPRAPSAVLQGDRGVLELVEGRAIREQIQRAANGMDRLVVVAARPFHTVSRTNTARLPATNVGTPH